MEINPQRRSSGSGQTSTPSSLRHCLYPSPAATVQSENKSLRHTSKSKNRSEPPRPPALTQVKGRIAMETPTRTGSEMSWLQDASPMARTPRTPQRSRAQTPDPKSSSFVNPSSILLQDLLKEQRATRGARTGGLEELEDSPQRTPEWCQTQSRSNSLEEPGSEKQQNTKMSSSGSFRRPPEMGVRETDQYISKISKQNFDLKLEIFHRVQQLSVLEKKLERMQELEEEVERMRGLEEEVQELRAAEEDNQRLRDYNEELRRDIDKRDQAVTEAVDLICDLEARLEGLGAMDLSQPSTAQPPFEDDSGLATPRNAGTPEIPERTSSRRGTRQSERRRVSSGSLILQRAPSFLLDENKSTAVLRSLYVEAEDNPVPQPTAITKSESMNSMAETVEPESPRLSALSECSELNINDTPITEDGFDQIDIPVLQKDTISQGTNVSSATLGKFDREAVHINQWIPTETDNPSKANVTRRRTRRLSEVFKEPEKSSPSSSFNGSSHRSKMESIFGSARLPPTPDTMITAYPGWSKGSSNSNSTIANKSQPDLGRQSLTRTRSADELTTRRSSINSEPRESMNSNLSKVTLPRPSIDDSEEDPAIFPLNNMHTANRGFFQENFGRVLARMDKDYYSPSRSTTRDGTASIGSSPPSLTAEDWVEAARTDTRNRTGPLPANSRLVGARAPSQSSFLGRRHSIDSAVREPTLPIIQTLNPRSLEDDDATPSPTTEPEPEFEPRRRISLLPPFFSRSGTTRRLQPSPMSDPIDKDDGAPAPAPVIRKTRNQPSKTPRPLSGQAGDFSASGPKYAEDHMSRSFTEANLFNSSINSATITAAKPSTSNGGKYQHKRRGSLGIFGWMKGASAGLGSSLKKSDAPPPTPVTPVKTDFPVTPTTAPLSTSAGATVRASSRLTPHGNVTLATAQEPPVEPATDEFATRTRHPTRTDEPADEQGRRPRYMERRSRRT